VHIVNFHQPSAIPDDVLVLQFSQEVNLFWKWLQLPVTKVVGVVKAPADQIFNLIMDYGPERHQ
jgi:hypothetical protein